MLDKISNGILRNALEVAPIFVKIREERLRWFGHVTDVDFCSGEEDREFIGGSGGAIEIIFEGFKIIRDETMIGAFGDVRSELMDSFLGSWWGNRS
ncbi:hypothetical protein OROGR_007348 [Orobanche gracilis]